MFCSSAVGTRSCCQIQSMGSPSHTLISPEPPKVWPHKTALRNILSRRERNSHRWPKEGMHRRRSPVPHMAHGRQRVLCLFSAFGSCCSFEKASTRICFQRNGFLMSVHNIKSRRHLKTSSLDHSTTQSEVEYKWPVLNNLGIFRVQLLCRFHLQSGPQCLDFGQIRRWWYAIFWLQDTIDLNRELCFLRWQQGLVKEAIGYTAGVYMVYFRRQTPDPGICNSWVPKILHDPAGCLWRWPNPVP